MLKDKKHFALALVVLALLLIIIFSFIKLNFDSTGVFLCEAVSANPNIEMSECPTHTSSTPNLIILGFTLAGVLLAIGAFLFVTKQIPAAPQKRTFKTVDISTLSEHERTIYQLIKESNGSIYQSELVKQTGFNKVKITRILDKLEHDDAIIERKRRGMTNLVVLK